MIRRFVLPAVVMAALLAAFAGALLAPTPDGLPAIALGSTLVWRVEVAAVVFVAAYGAIVTTRLALYGHTYTRVGSAGIEIPQVARSEKSETGDRTLELQTSVGELRAAIDALAERLSALEQSNTSAVEPPG